MAKERTLIGIKMKEFLVYFREHAEQIVVENSSKYRIGKYTFSIRPYTLKKEGEWEINFSTTYGQYYYPRLEEIRLCCLEGNITERVNEIGLTEENLAITLDDAVKLEFLDELNKVIRNNYNETFSKIVDMVDETLDSYTDLL